MKKAAAPIVGRPQPVTAFGRTICYNDHWPKSVIFVNIKIK
jgi:hypothetical protein